jgi:hypothetical protein
MRATDVPIRTLWLRPTNQLAAIRCRFAALLSSAGVYAVLGIELADQISRGVRAADAGTRAGKELRRCRRRTMYLHRLRRRRIFVNCISN